MRRKAAERVVVKFDLKDSDKAKAPRSLKLVAVLNFCIYNINIIFYVNVLPYAIELKKKKKTKKKKKNWRRTNSHISCARLFLGPDAGI